MHDGTLPNDTREATEALQQRKLILAEVLNEMLKHGYTQAFQVSGLINNKIDSIDKRIETGDLWEMEDE